MSDLSLRAVRSDVLRRSQPGVRAAASKLWALFPRGLCGNVAAPERELPELSPGAA